MIKKLLILLVTSFIIFVFSLSYFHFKEEQFNSYLTKIKKIKTVIENKDLKPIESVQVKTWDKINTERLLEDAVANELSDIDFILKNNQKNNDWSDLRYKRLYINSMKKRNINSAIKAIKKILNTTKNKDIWLWKLVKLYIQIWDFKDAEIYSKKLLFINPTKDDFKSYLYVKLQNTDFFDVKQVKDLKDLIKIYCDKNIITSQELSFYYFLINLLSNWNIDKISTNLHFLLKDIKTNEQTGILFNINKDLSTYKSVKWTPLYYFKALVALDLLKWWYFGLANNLSKQIYIENSSYILPQQILAYSYFYMWDYRNALKYFKLLKQNDIQNQMEYNFFIWISYYWLDDNRDSLLYLSQLWPKFKYYLDVLRYKLLGYINIKDTDNIITTIKELSNYKLNYVDYYNIFKYLLFNCKDCYKKNIKLLVNLILSCYKNTDLNHKYVCYYAKANLYQDVGNYNLATKYYILITKYFQDPYIFWNIASYYEKHWDKKRAKLYYLKELLFTENGWKRDILKKKIKNLFLNK